MQNEVFGHRSVDPKFIDNFYLKRLKRNSNEAISDDYVDPDVEKQHPKYGPRLQRLITQILGKEGCHIYGQLATNKVF